MPKAKSETQLFRLFDLLATSPETGIPKDQIVAKLGVKESSVPVYIHSLKKKFGAEIENITEGRVVTGYILKNKPEVPQFKRAAVPVLKKATNSTSSVQTGDTPILDREVDAEYSDRETADIQQSIGYSNTNGDY